MGLEAIYQAPRTSAPHPTHRVYPYLLTCVLKNAGIRISMHGRGWCMDNIFIERLWRSLKYKAVYLHELTDGFVAGRAIRDWMDFYNTERPHFALDGKASEEAYWTGRSMDMMDKADALPTSRPAQQRQVEINTNSGLAARSEAGIHL